jgi:hypothetical protein
MKLAILFWFYKKLGICKNRLELIRKNNPNTAIYGVYGGNLATVNEYKLQLDPYLDDFYAFSEPKDPNWKWLHGDLILTDWYRERGKDLPFDTVVVVQWDMLIFGAVEQIFSMLEPDRILLSGLRSIAEVEDNWHWVTPKVPDERRRYLEFMEHIVKTYDYQQDPLGCIFIVACLPRIFLDAYSQIEQPELGFLEYRIPIYAQIFGVTICEHHPFKVWWIDEDPYFNSQNLIHRFMNFFILKFNANSLRPTFQPTRSDISLIPIFKNSIAPKGDRIFHPYQTMFPMSKWQWLWALIDELKRDVEWGFQRIFKTIQN